MYNKVLLLGPMFNRSCILSQDDKEMIGHCISSVERRSGGTVDEACKCTAVRGTRACAGVGTKTLRPSVDCFTSARALTRSPKVKLTRFIADNNTRVSVPTLPSATPRLPRGTHNT